MRNSRRGPRYSQGGTGQPPTEPPRLGEILSANGLVNRSGLEGCLLAQRGTTRSGLKGFAGTNEGEGEDMRIFDAARGLTLSSELLTLQHQFQKQGGLRHVVMEAPNFSRGPSAAILL